MHEATIVQGVENMQLLYGEDTNAADTVTNATKYVTAGNVTDWNNVVSVRLGLLVNSQALLQPLMMRLPMTLRSDAVAAANDHLRRRAYSSTVVIRNRMQGS